MGNNIVVFTRSLPMHNIGGMEVVCWDLCCSLAKRGYKVSVVTTSLPGVTTYETYNGNLNVIPIDGTIPGKYSSQWWRNSAKYLHELSGENILAVISISAAGFSCLRYKSEFQNTKFIMQAHGTSFDEFVSKIKSCSLKKWCGSIKNVFWFFKDANSYNKFDYVVAIGDSVESSMKRFPTSAIIKKESVVKIENGIDTDLFMANSSSHLKKEVLEKFNINDKAVVVVSASRLHSEKGVDNNLIAFKKFNERVKNSYYLICGDGVEKDNLLQLSKDLGIISNVRFLGGIDRKFLSNILNCADIFLFLTKRVEGLPLNVLEAMSVGVPMIVSNHLTFTESKKLRKVVNNEYEHIADQMVGVVNFSNGGKESYIPTNNTLSYSAEKYCRLINN